MTKAGLIGIILIGVFGAAGCQNPHGETPVQVPQPLVHSRVRLGDAREAVYVALGRPERVEPVGDATIWTYTLQVSDEAGSVAVGRGQVMYVVTESLVEKQMATGDLPSPVTLRRIKLSFTEDRLVKIQSEPAGT